MVFFSPLYSALPIDAPSSSAFLGNARRAVKKAREIITGNKRRCNIVAHCLMARGASLRQYNGAESTGTVPSLVLTQRFIYVRGGSVVEVSRIRSILVNKQNNFK